MRRGGVVEGQLGSSCPRGTPGESNQSLSLVSSRCAVSGVSDVIGFETAEGGTFVRCDGGAAGLDLDVNHLVSCCDLMAILMAFARGCCTMGLCGGGGSSTRAGRVVVGARGRRDGGSVLYRWIYWILPWCWVGMWASSDQSS